MFLIKKTKDMRITHENKPIISKDNKVTIHHITIRINYTNLDSNYPFTANITHPSHRLTVKEGTDIVRTTRGTTPQDAANKLLNNLPNFRWTTKPVTKKQRTI